MKNKPAKLLFHSLHSRPMPGCLPLFFLMAAAVTGVVIALVHVTLPQQLRPRGVGNVYYRNDELTRFQVRQSSALPLRLPAYADPAAHSPAEAPGLPLKRELTPLPAPPYSLLSDAAPDSAVLDAGSLLALPPAEAPQQEGGEP